MKMGKVSCQSCKQESVRNIHNKCVYCGFKFDQEHHLSNSERESRLEQIEATTERLADDIEKDKTREKQRQIEIKQRNTVVINPIIK